MTSMHRVVLAASALLATALSAAGQAEPYRQLTFEQRVAAQRAIERVYYSHQEGATRPFDEAVPPGLARIEASMQAPSAAILLVAPSTHPGAPRSAAMA